MFFLLGDNFFVVVVVATLTRVYYSVQLPETA
jgi:hypothetical protein